MVAPLSARGAVAWSRGPPGSRHARRWSRAGFCAPLHLRCVGLVRRRGGLVAGRAGGGAGRLAPIRGGAGVGLRGGALSLGRGGGVGVWVGWLGWGVVAGGGGAGGAVCCVRFCLNAVIFGYLCIVVVVLYTVYIVLGARQGWGWCWCHRPARRRRRRRGAARRQPVASGGLGKPAGIRPGVRMVDFGLLQGDECTIAV